MPDDETPMRGEASDEDARNCMSDRRQMAAARG